MNALVMMAALAAGQCDECGRRGVSVNVEVSAVVKPRVKVVLKSKTVHRREVRHRDARPPTVRHHVFHHQRPLRRLRWALFRCRR